MVKASEELAEKDQGFLFTLSISTGRMQYGPDLFREKYTYIKVKQIGKKFNRNDYPDGMYVKVIGRLDSDVYFNGAGKRVFNKVVLADTIDELDMPLLG